jgi:hypothetical protein
MKYRTLNIPSDIITGYKETRTPDEILKNKKRVQYAESLGLIGVFDETNRTQKEQDRALAMEFILSDKPLPEDLLQRILKYKAEDEEEFKKIKQED